MKHEQIASTAGERRAEYGKRRKSYNEESFPFELQERREAEGWTVSRTNKNSVRMRLDRSVGEQLENRFWSVLYLFGYHDLNIGRHFKIPVKSQGAGLTKQIDVFAKDDETVIIAECKASSIARDRSLQKDLGEMIGNQKAIASSIRSFYGKDFKPKILWFFVTDKVRWSDNDLQRAAANNIKVIQSKELRYLEEIAKKLGSAAKYQFHAEYLSTQKIPALSGRSLPAVKTKIGGHTAYFFSALPVDILRIAFVNHRDLRDPEGAPAYQRLVNPNRLKEIGAFLDDGGFFPNTVLLNFHRKPTFNKRTTDGVSGVQFGDLLLPDRYKSCWVIDGQHRLYGTTHADADKAGSQPLFFIAFENIPAAEEAKLFVTINEKQTKVPKNLLAELDGEVKWGSEDPKEMLDAIASRSVDLLNVQGAGALEDRIATPGLSDATERPLSLPSFQNAIIQAKLLGYVSSRTKEFIPGVCWDGNSEKSLHRLVDVLGAYFSDIEAAAPDRWARGKEGYLCSNFGVAGHVRLIGEVTKYIEAKEGLNPIETKRSELRKLLREYTSPVSDFLESASDEEFEEKFKVPFGSGGYPRYFFGLVSIMRTQYSDFEPEGYEEFVQTVSDDETREADQQVRWIQTTTAEEIVRILKSEYGGKYFEKGVPKDIQKRCQAKRIDDEVEQQHPVETYLDWIDLKKIVEQRELREKFLDVFSIQFEHDQPGRHIYLGWFDQFNVVRRIPAHPAGRFYKQSDIEFLNKLTAELERRIKVNV